MNIVEEMNGDLLILKMRDARLDASTAPALREALIERIAKGQQSIILDLGEVGFMDSSALGALIAAVKKLGPLGTIAVAQMRTPVARLFSVTKMDRVFSVNATVNDAIRSLGA
ncbi:STAS domain-containing protein [Tabrizicola sp. BL-A-41-H6]|uniref:STAS domain-containing protein n=1 Tax=Tabrizicola sp. BL-A-41-H6 TaxID=3421107 RepID=UPI003D67BDF9